MNGSLSFVMDKDDDTVESFGSKLSFPDKIYGREGELQHLHKLYESFCRCSSKDDLRPGLPSIETVAEDGEHEEDEIPFEIQDIVASMLEYEKAMESEARNGEGEVPLILISGYSGCGKTALINKFIEQVDKKAKIAGSDIHPCYFLSGKCDEYSGGSAYAALAQAINEFCDEVLLDDAIVLEKVKKEIIAGVIRSLRGRRQGLTMHHQPIVSHPRRAPQVFQCYR